MSSKPNSFPKKGIFINKNYFDLFVREKIKLKYDILKEIEVWLNSQ